MAEKPQAGVFGLGTMGGGIAAALSEKEFDIFGLEPVAAGISAARTRVALAGFTIVSDPAALVAALRPPRRFLMMVPAGDPVDTQIGALRPHLAPGDVLIDGGNSHFDDTARRASGLGGSGIHYLGCGILGGERGARDGASVMARGAKEGFEAARDMLEAIAAADDRGACCGWFGEGGAGHFVKMVHKGIEYAVMQAIGEAWLFLRDGLGFDAEAIARQVDH